MSVTESGMMTCLNELQWAKAKSPMLQSSEEFAMTSSSNELQFMKAWGPIDVTDLGMVTALNDLQLSKPAAPMSVTELGIVKLSNEMQFLKAQTPILKLAPRELSRKEEARNISTEICPATGRMQNVT